jgi:hypothetical protein
MIVKRKNKWEVRDSSGKKILGRHSNKSDAIKQLAAIEISKKEEESKETNESLNNFMHLIDNFEKLKCARLQEEKMLLTSYLNNIKSSNLANLIYEGPNGPTPPIASAPTTGMAPMMGTQQVGGKKAKIRKTGEEDEDAKSEDTNDAPHPFDMAQAHHGLALTPQIALAQKNMLTTFYDDPRTANREVAQKPTWQNLQQSVGNYVGAQVNQLLRQQRMLG